ncbi:MAG: asparagine synthase-related protein [Colwellia sp.]|nr:asparagine synthase-related protein [Colwellia sp.]
MHRFCILVTPNDLDQLAIKEAKEISQGFYLWEDINSNPTDVTFKQSDENNTLYLFGDVKNVCTASVKSSLLNKSELPYEQFVSILYCKNNKTVTLAADPTGIQSLFWMKIKEDIIISSSLDFLTSCIHWHNFQPSNISEEFCLQYGYIPLGKSVYSNVNELLPTQCCIITHQSCISAKYWSNKYINNINVEQYSDPIDRLYYLMKSVIIEQLGDSKKVGVLLGGFDSALVAAFIAKLGIKVETYTFEYETSHFNQPFIKEIGEIENITTNWVKITPKILEELLTNYNKISNYPTLWLGYVLQTAYLTKQMHAKGIYHCLSGDGCDTAFMGYPSTHNRGNFYKKLPRIPIKLSNAIIKSVEFFRLEYFLGHIYRVIVSMLNAATFSLDARPIRSFQIFNPESINKLRGKMPSDTDKVTALIEEYDAKLLGLSFDRKMYHAKSYFSPNRNKLTTSTNMNGVFIKSPYLHPAIKQFVAALPDKYFRSKSSSDEGKEILMAMAERYQILPKEIIYQKKLAAISSPIDDWLSSSLKETCIKKIEKSHIKGNYKHLFNSTFIEKLYKKYFSNDNVVSLAASLLTTYSSFFNDKK